MKNIKLKDLIALILLVAVVATNPWTNQMIIEALETALMFISREAGVWVTLAGAGYFIAYIFHNMWTTREKVNIPKKSSRTLKAGKLIET